MVVVKLRYLLILLFFVLALSPVLLFRAWPHSDLLDLEIAEVEERHLLLARNLAASLEHYAEDVDATFVLLSRNNSLWSRIDLVNAMMAPLGMRNLCIVERSTGVVIDRLIRDGATCPDPRSPALDAMLDRAARNSTAFSEVSAAQNGENIMYLATSLSDDHIAVGSIGTQHFIKLGSAISFGVRGHAALVDHAGNVLSHPRPDWVAARRNIIGVSAVQRMLAGEDGITVFFSPALESDMVAGFAPVRGPGWGAMVPQPIEELHAKVSYVQQSTFFVLLIGSLGALGLALLASYVTVRPLEALTNVARNVSLGQLNEPQPLRFRAFQPLEMRQLHNGVRTMVRRLRKYQRHINKLAFFDTTTELPNRECFRRRVETFIGKAGEGRVGALLFIDLDGFKAVNDTLGHDVGDHVLAQVGVRLNRLLGQDRLGPEDPILMNVSSETSVARLGGDEFALFLPNKGSEEALALGERVRMIIEDPILHDDRTLTLGASVGVACFPDDATDYGGLLKAADIAMYDAKRSGKNRARSFSASRSRRNAERDEMAADLFSTEVSRQIDVHYQPVYRARDMQVASVEGLIRWQHPKYGLLPPNAFFELVSQLGLQRQIDMLAFVQAVEALSSMPSRGVAPPQLTLNIPVDRLQDKIFVDAVRAVHPLPFRLGFEVVETAACDVSFDEVHWAVDQLRDAGVCFELDDFGTAQASITAMLGLAPHRIKIDASLTSGVVDSLGKAHLISGLVDLAHALEVEVVAKGVESPDQAKCLRGLGVDYLQGFALSRPLELEELTEYLGGSPRPVMVM